MHYYCHHRLLPALHHHYPRVVVVVMSAQAKSNFKNNLKELSMTPAEELTYVMPQSLTVWTRKDDSVPAQVTLDGNVKPAFIPMSSPDVSTYYTKNKKEYITIHRRSETDENAGYYHLSTKEAWERLAGDTYAVEYKSREKFNECTFFAGCLVCLPCLCNRMAENNRHFKYKKVAEKRSAMEVPTGNPHKHPHKYKAFYTKEGHWIVPHQMRMELR